MFKEVLEVRRAELGKRHPHTLASLVNFANTLSDMDKEDEAEPLYREALAANREIDGDLHSAVRKLIM